MGANTITVLTSSYNPVSFTADGMRRNDGSFYKISEKDLHILKKLGQGASSVVHKGFYAMENKFVAIKKINVFEKDTRHQMLNDIKALCDSPNLPGLVNFYGAYSVPESGQVSIVLEYLDGGSLGDVLAKVGPIPENILSKITAKILTGLNYLHRNKHLVHRDIKPANILMNLNGEPKITDFGISAFINSTLAVCNTFLGTVTYMSPERINNQSYSFSADMWSLGLALVECALGKYPYDASVGPLQLMIEVRGPEGGRGSGPMLAAHCGAAGSGRFAVLQNEIPLPPAGQFSEEFRDFISQCMQKDPYARPSAEKMLQHPFITVYERDPVDLKAWMQVAYDPNDKLDEIAIVFAFNYYTLLGPERMEDLASMYTDKSCLSYNGEEALYGRQAIVGKLSQVAMTHSTFKMTHRVREVDCQPLGQDGSAVVFVQGTLEAGPGVPQAPMPYTEVFVLSQVLPGEYYVANQTFRLL
ncbi:MAG: hypothetical protein WDW36_008849 [Sanguina aurantia]